MTVDGLLVVQTLFSSAWAIFTSFEIPGTHTTPAAFLMAMIFIAFVVRNIGRIFQTGSDVERLSRSSHRGDD